MELPNAQTKWAGLGPVSPRNTAWFLDIDGTLLEIAPTPKSVSAGPKVASLLVGLQEASGGALALVSGRSVTALDKLFAPLRLPAAGQHGVERRDIAGTTHYHQARGRRLPGARTAIAEFAAQRPGLLIEDKGLSIALHFRQAPSLEGEVYEFLGAIEAGARGELCLQPGKMVLEIKPCGRDKGLAIEEFLAEPPFCGRRPVFVGDDISDELGFITVNRLGGLSVKVGNGPSAATRRLPDVSAVLDWLGQVVGSSP